MCIISLSFVKFYISYLIFHLSDYFFIFFLGILNFLFQILDIRVVGKSFGSVGINIECRNILILADTTGGNNVYQNSKIGHTKNVFVLAYPNCL